MTIPQATDELSALMGFIETMKADYDGGKFRGWEDFADAVHAWYTPDRLQAIDEVVMGWQKMASYADQKTLVHVTAALVSLLSLPDYQSLTDDDKNLALWIVLYHDVAKIGHPKKRDHTHGFRSAATCGAGIMGADYVPPVEPLKLYMWHGMTTNARVYSAEHDDYIQDNNKLPGILDGIEDLFGGWDSPAGLMIRGVLFHMSLDVVDEFPQVAPLTNQQIKRYISPRLLPLLKVMMLTDNAAWSLFDLERRKIERQQLEREFKRVADLIGESESP